MKLNLENNEKIMELKIDKNRERYKKFNIFLLSSILLLIINSINI